MMIFVVWQLEILTVMLLQVLEDMSGSVLGIRACREGAALVFVLELVAAMAKSFSIV